MALFKTLFQSYRNLEKGDTKTSKMVVARLGLEPGPLVQPVKTSTTKPKPLPLVHDGDSLLYLIVL